MLLETMPAFAAQKPADAVLSESFENYITGAFPSSFTKSGAVNAYTAETGKADKALCIVKGADHGGVIQTDRFAIAQEAMEKNMNAVNAKRKMEYDIMVNGEKKNAESGNREVNPDMAGATEASA